MKETLYIMTPWNYILNCQKVQGQYFLVRIQDIGYFEKEGWRNLGPALSPYEENNNVNMG